MICWFVHHLKGITLRFLETLIGNLSKEGISVESEAEHAEIDCRKLKLLGIPTAE